MKGLPKPTPGPLFARVKWLSWIELGFFGLLILFWLLPGFEVETMVFGWAHGLGFIVLCLVIWVACGRREAPYTLLAATLTPVGPVGSVIGIELIERKGLWVDPRGRAGERRTERGKDAGRSNSSAIRPTEDAAP
ncbi:MAG TPA: hypothetical protein VFW48_03490 [Solirubrobacterales bacterium]|nr:hypothetical protein [Solirubrobacterales bacterium]